MEEINTQLNVLIADDHPLFRSALKQAVTHACVTENLDCQLIEANDANEMMRFLNDTPDVDLIFLDLHMPGNKGFVALTQILNHFPDIEVIMVSADEQAEIMLQAIDFGASAFIPKSSDLETISAAINTVLDGETWLPSAVLDIENVASNPEVEARRKLTKQLSELTPQQYKVLSLIAHGQLNKQIAYELDIKETTVKKHVSAILEKLQVNNRTLAGMAFQQLQLNAS